MTYSEKLKDPRGQRRRLEVLQSANFSCQDCRDATQTLHVHHGRYEKGKEPWEAMDSDLMCVCSDCHRHRQTLEDEVKAGMSCLPYNLLNALSTASLMMGHVGHNMEKRFGDDLASNIIRTVHAKEASWNNVERF